ncbi:unnamed protein product [Leuciscus chuanchicus]
MLAGVRLSSCFCSSPLIDGGGLYHAQKDQRETNRTSTERKLDLAEDTNIVAQNTFVVRNNWKGECPRNVFE